MTGDANIIKAASGSVSGSNSVKSLPHCLVFETFELGNPNATLQLLLRY